MVWRWLLGLLPSPGFWLLTLTTTAILVDAATNIYYDNGVYYQQGNGGYTVITAPAGVGVSTLPEGFVTTPVGSNTYYYYLGTFYTQDPVTGNYVVVNAPESAIVPYLPEGYTIINRGSQEYYQFGGTYYQPYYESDTLLFRVVYL